MLRSMGTFLIGAATLGFFVGPTLSLSLADLGGAGGGGGLRTSLLLLGGCLGLVAKDLA